MRKFLIVMYVSIAECKVIKISCLLGGFLRIIIIIKLKNAKFAAWIKCSAVATAPWFISFENGREFCRKVLLKFYLPHSNLAVRISSEDTIAIAPALIAVSMPVRPCISISVWGCCFIRCCGTPRPECGIKQRYISHTFFICFYECLCGGVRMSMFFCYGNGCVIPDALTSVSVYCWNKSLLGVDIPAKHSLVWKWYCCGVPCY